jgi:MSHA pilin protein MshD
MSTSRRGPASALADRASRSSRDAQGLSLIELIVFIVIVSVAVVGVVGVLSISARGSAEPMIQKQALAIAEAVLEEIQLQPFTYCDPDDPQAATAQSAAVGANGCSAAGTVEAIGAEGETRTGSPPYDNVNDYNAFAMAGITNIAGAAIVGLENYTATVAVAGQDFAGIVNDANGRPQSLLITVTVTGPGDTTVTLHGYRTRYAPNALP